MIDVFLFRREFTDQGTPGILSVPEKTFACFSIELPWRDNQVGISCIPVGEYICEYYYSTSFRQFLYRICNVPDRTGVAVHSGNVAGDKSKGYRSHSLGCLLLGERRGKLWGQEAILLSRFAMGKFSRLMNKNPYKLHIIGGG